MVWFSQSCAITGVYHQAEWISAGSCDQAGSSRGGSHRTPSKCGMSRLWGASDCDPWLSQAATAWLFNLGYPQHNAAWKSFYDWLDRSEDFEATVFPRKEKIWKFVASKVGPVHSYGEIGCPFMGLFSYFECLKKTPLESFLNFEQRSVQQIRRSAPTRFCSQALVDYPAGTED